MKETTTSDKIERLLAAVQELSLARNLDTVTRIVRKAARDLSGADGATFVLRRNDKCYYADEDAIGPLWKGMSFPLERCISGWCMLNHRIVAIEDIYQDDRIPHDAYRPTFVKSLLMVPIREEDPIGAIGNYWESNHVPSAHEIKMLQMLAKSTMVALENIRLYDEMEQRVKDRTAELEASNRALEAFSYSVSHDLRAPLRKISYFTELLIEDYKDKLEDKGADWLNKLDGQAREMSHLIDVLLGFSRMGRAPLRKTQLSMQEMVEEICRSLSEQETGRNIRFDIKTLPSSPADKDLIRQVWVNLLSNAVKYSGRREEAIVEVGAETKENAVVYYVRDNGVGFDMNYADKLFSPFQRLHSRGEFEGTGIGLATVERILAKHGGKIWAEAAPDKGACFYFELPIGR
ncbi:MAG: GAF domain-containing protein [Bacteroidetes bacterium]|nr:GAF domain-containing protein [Bacteroidota bacterium]